MQGVTGCAYKRGLTADVLIKFPYNFYLTAFSLSVILYDLMMILLDVDSFRFIFFTSGKPINHKWICLRQRCAPLSKCLACLSYQSSFTCLRVYC